jgi:hypothetical protein
LAEGGTLPNSRGGSGISTHSSHIFMGFRSIVHAVLTNDIYQTVFRFTYIFHQVPKIPHTLKKYAKIFFILFTLFDLDKCVTSSASSSKPPPFLIC